MPRPSMGNNVLEDNIKVKYCEDFKFILIEFLGDSSGSEG
jgi:hypothetical protein